MTEKRCPSCEQTKPVSEFHLSLGRKDGLYNYCKTCNCANARAYVADHPEQVKASKGSHYANNREAVMASNKRWYLANRQRGNAIRMAHKAKKRFAHSVIHHSAAERLNLFTEYCGLCAYCLAPANTIDHVVPAAMGGSNGIENIVPACGPCNFSKSDKPLLVWMADRRVA